ncbi:hypothetical protein MMC30_005685 [Trapelia coarctata]|nr:hypothetical protein [Trapelia coarctata]
MSSQLYDSYQYLITHIVPGPNSISYFIPVLILPSALLIPPSFLSKTALASLFLPIIYACFAHSCLHGGGLDVLSLDVVIWATVLLGLQDPRGTYKRIHLTSNPSRQTSAETEPKSTPCNGGKKDESQDSEPPLRPSRISPLTTWEEPYPPTFLRRLPWVFTLIFSIRLCNWRISSPQHDAKQPHASISRLAYIRRSLLIASTSFLILDTAAICVKNDPYFLSPTLGITSALPPVSANSIWPLSIYHLLPPPIARVLILCGHIYPLLTLPSALLSLPLLLLPEPWSPHTHPPLFGSFAAIPRRGLRGLWGQWWHQLMRYLTSLPGASLSRALGLRPGSRKDYICRVIVSFGLSGCIHMGLVPPEPRYATTWGKWGTRGWIAGFFWVQVIGFGVEVVVEGWWKRAGWGKSGVWAGRWGRWVRAVAVMLWVLCWVALTVPMVGVAGKELGWFVPYPLPVSFWTRQIYGEGALFWWGR